LASHGQHEEEEQEKEKIMTKLRSLIIAGALLAAPVAASAQVLTPDVRSDGYYTNPSAHRAAPRGIYPWNSYNKNMSGPGNEGAIHDNGTGGGDGGR
jgi:hypothetical protein